MNSHPRVSHAVLAVIVVLLGASIADAGAAQAPRIPPGYSTEIVDVKFRDAGDLQSFKTTQTPTLPPQLVGAITSMTPLFSVPSASLNTIRAQGLSRSQKALPDLDRWFRIQLAPGTDAALFLEELRRSPDVEIAEPAPLPQRPPATTPDFTANQGYLDVAPGGIDARFAWTLPGGNGAGIRVYDVEYSWNQTHEDLGAASGVTPLVNAGDSAVDPFTDNNHGTAVLGEMIATNDTKGVTGICWGAGVGLAPANTTNLGYNLPNAIMLAVADGTAGDVILIEQQACVCGLPCPSDCSKGCGPVEFNAPTFAAIQAAVAAGFVVVEAAGNGNVNLDQAACGTTFDRTVQDSGAIIVGAGQPPGSGADRQREAFSTYGSRVDVQGWGSGVTTTGYGTSYMNADDPGNANFWYTAGFNGTSSASPIVAGAAVDLQGIATLRFGAPLQPFQIRELLTLTGSPQEGNTKKHIGPRPDLRRASTFVLDGDITRWSGKASGVGQGSGQAGVRLVGMFEFQGTVDLAACPGTLTITSLLDEGAGAGELVTGPPLTLHGDCSNTSTVARFKTDVGQVPIVEVAIGRRDHGKFTLRVEASQATIGVAAGCPTTTMTTAFVIEDGVNLPVNVSTDQPWLCFGKGNQYLKSPS
jgi:hypothetical protein